MANQFLSLNKKHYYMNKLFLVIFSLFCIIIIGCNSVKSILSSTMFKATQPQLLTNDDILKATLKYKLDTNRLLHFNNSNDFVQMLSSLNLSIPDVIIIDSNKHFLQYRQDSTECTGAVFKVIDSLISGKQLSFLKYKADSTFFHLTKTYFFNKERNFEFDRTKQYHIFLVWATYGIGTKNKSFVRKLQNKLKKNEVNYHFYLLNIDLNSSWDIALTKDKD